MLLGLSGRVERPWVSGGEVVRCHLGRSLSGAEKRRLGAPEGEAGGDLGAGGMPKWREGKMSDTRSIYLSICVWQAKILKIR